MRAAFVSLILAGALLAPAPAHAVDLTLKIEPGLALALDSPQSELFGAGGEILVKGAVGLARWFALQATVGFLGLPATSDTDSAAFAYFLGGGPRLFRPHGKGLWFPWLDGDAMYVRTGPLNRFSFALAAGVAFPLGAARQVWFGPYVRYLQIVETARPGYDDSDAKIVCAGLSIEVGAPRRIATLGGRTGVDKDGDGIPDEYDVCPNQPEDRDGFQDEDGCPEPDNDKDGILDKDDLCPNQPEDKDGYKDDDGCPDLDNDGDGIPDKTDKCPNQAEDRDGFQDDDGCPEDDNDSDGVKDKDDKCPNLPGTAESFGCPDRDLDGTTDQDDQCPDVPGPPENKGCPSYKNVTVTKETLELAQKIFFAHDLTRILPRSFPLLDEVAQALKDHPKLEVRIEGHTDSTGREQHNRTLSAGRAFAVRDYLIQRGVEAKRLDAKGYGSALPIDTNKSVSGRENNRRVEFVITVGAEEK
jgi:outer membrane protein OmpA-like peptidoglycan-associated protein